MNKTKLTKTEQRVLLLRLKKNYNYDDVSGRLVNARTGRAPKGCFSPCGYIRLGLRIGDKIVRISMHRAVFAYHYGRWPKKPIDHINGCKTDNRIENLREVSLSENQMNRVYPWKPNKDTGLPGVSVFFQKNVYRHKVHRQFYYFHDPYEAFYHLTLLGRRFEASEASEAAKGLNKKEKI